MKRHCCQASPKYSLQIGSIFRSDAKGHRAPIWRATVLKFLPIGRTDNKRYVRSKAALLDSFAPNAPHLDRTTTSLET